MKTSFQAYRVDLRRQPSGTIVSVVVVAPSYSDAEKAIVVAERIDAHADWNTEILSITLIADEVFDLKGRRL